MIAQVRTGINPFIILNKRKKEKAKKQRTPLRMAAVGNFIVVLKDGTSAEQKNNLIEELKGQGANISHVYDIFPGFAGAFPQAALDHVNASPLLSSIEADGVVSTC